MIGTQEIRQRAIQAGVDETVIERDYMLSWVLHAVCHVD